MSAQLHKIDAVKSLRELLYQIQEQAVEGFWESTAPEKDVYLKKIQQLCDDGLRSTAGAA